ncbi:MAG: S41 family peptidase, partial [Actinomycetes bacterium]
LKGLVIDVRVNDGGSDVYGTALAARLTKKPYTAYSKIARDDPVDVRRFTSPQQADVLPSPDTTYTGPIALLTSRYSVSAAETFTQALLGRGDMVRIGENTQGVFSDQLLRTLPDGAQFSLPNEIYLTNGRNYDMAGFAPDVPTGLVFAHANLAAGKDPELDAALARLAR